jgi:hypothetical protein
MSDNTEDRDKKGRFVKGNDAGFSSRPEDINRNGRPPRPSLTDALVRKLNAEGDDSRASGKKIADALVDAALKEALRGSFQHLREIWSRLDGKDTTVPVEEGVVLKDKTEHHAAAVSLYRSIITDPTSTPKDRLTAQAELNRLLGLTEEEASPQEHARNIQKALADMLDATLSDEEEDPKDGVTRCDGDK